MPSGNKPLPSANVDPDLCCQMASLGLNELNEQSGCLFTHHILNAYSWHIIPCFNYWNFFLESSLTIIHFSPIDNYLLLAQVMVWHWSGKKPLPFSFTHICITRHQWVNSLTASQTKQWINPTQLFPRHFPQMEITLILRDLNLIPGSVWWMGKNGKNKKTLRLGNGLALTRPKAFSWTKDTFPK